MQEKIIILDFGSQYTQLIGRRVRELNVYCEIYPFNHFPEMDSTVKGVILSGSPYSVRDENGPRIDMSKIKGKFPLLGVCYGAQYLAHFFGGEVAASDSREYGRANLRVTDKESVLLLGISENSQVWMSHGDTIISLPENYKIIASTGDVENAAYKIEGEDTYAIQFHPDIIFRNSHYLCHLLVTQTVEVHKRQRSVHLGQLTDGGVKPFHNFLFRQRIHMARLRPG